MKIMLARKLFSIAAIVLVLIALTGLSTPVLAAPSTLVSVSAPNQSIAPGTQFTVNITVLPNGAIVGAQFNLSFNPSLVSVNNISEGNLFKQNGASTYFIHGTINNTAGTITGVADVVLGMGQSVSSPGTFATISMTAAANSGISALNLANVIVGDSNGQPLSVTLASGQVVINNVTTTPTTTTTTPTTTTTTPTTTTTTAGVSGGRGGGIASPTTSGFTSVTSYVNAQGIFSQNINIWSDDTNAVLNIPAGTTGLTAGGTSLAQISFNHTTIIPAFQTGAGMIDMAYDITPNGITFSPPVTLKFTYYNLPAGVDPSTLQIAYYDTTENTWVVVPSTIDTSNNLISAQISHFTVYAISYGVKQLTSTTTTATNNTQTTITTATTSTFMPVSTTTNAAMVPLPTTSETTSLTTSTSTPVAASASNIGVIQTVPLSSRTILVTNASITPPATTNTTTPSGTMTVRMVILAVAIGVAVFLMTITGIFIWLRHRHLVKKDGYLN